MNRTNSSFSVLCARLAGALAVTTALSAGFASGSAQAAVPGIGGQTFNLVASDGMQTQPDGASIYTWGYGCASTYTPNFVPASVPAGAVGCPLWQVPGPTMVVTEGQPVTITLTNNLPVAAGPTSIIFSGFSPTISGGVNGTLTQEAPTGATITYTFTPTHPGTYAYHSGSNPELQVEMGLYGALIVLPATTPTTCRATGSSFDGHPDFRLAASAYDHPQTCYDREYLFQLTEMDSTIHAAAQAQVQACAAALTTAGVTSCPAISVKTEPYLPNYFLINGRSMPDDMDPPYAPQYAHQPYNGNPHLHPTETMLIRQIAHGRIQHPLHIHGNHARVIARDGNMLLSPVDQKSFAGPLIFTFPTVSGLAVDALFQWTGKGLNWDVYGHVAGDNTPCYPDANGYYTSASLPPAVPGVTPNYGEWCADHDKPIPITPPDAQIVANGLWYGGTPYLGLQTSPVGGKQFISTPLPPGTAIQNQSAGYAFMWHSHDEREITTNDVFPGGMMMMMIIDPPSAFIDETL